MLFSYDRILQHRVVNKRLILRLPWAATAVHPIKFRLQGKQILATLRRRILLFMGLNVISFKSYSWGFGKSHSMRVSLVMRIGLQNRFWRLQKNIFMWFSCLPGRRTYKELTAGCAAYGTFQQKHFTKVAIWLWAQLRHTAKLPNSQNQELWIKIPFACSFN